MNKLGFHSYVSLPEGVDTQSSKREPTTLERSAMFLGKLTIWPFSIATVCLPEGTGGDLRGLRHLPMIYQ